MSLARWKTISNHYTRALSHFINLCMMSVKNTPLGNNEDPKSHERKCLSTVVEFHLTIFEVLNISRDLAIEI